MRCYGRGARSLVLLTLGIGQAATKVVSSTSPRVSTAAGARPTQTTVPDGEIEKAIRARFAASKISTNHFQVHVQGGMATIEGNTNVLQHKGTATRLAKSAGATKVMNHVVVSQEAKDRAVKNLTSGRRRAQVKRSEVTKRSEKRSG